MVADDASRIPNVTLAANIRKIGFVNDPRFDRVANKHPGNRHEDGCRLWRLVPTQRRRNFK
jgi:hypothetical protein